MHGSPQQFHDWTLAQLIDVDVLKPYIKKFGHGLRELRNYIHPCRKMASEFTLGEHAEKVCFQVINAALASLARERP